MARIDSILSIVVQQGATELRLGTDREPKMLAHGTPRRLALPVTSDDMLRHLLGEILSPDREKALLEKGRVEVTYDAGTLGPFHVVLAGREAAVGFDVVFARGARGASHSTPTPGVARVHSMPETQTVATRDATGAETFASLVARAAAMCASDLHLTDARPPAVRIDGALHVLDEPPIHSVEALVREFLNEAVRARIALGSSADLALELDGVGRLRVNAYRASTGFAVAVRILARVVPTLHSLHMPTHLEDLVDLPHGLVIVCGPTGAGKTTTLAALAQEALRRRSVLLLSLEDPIEYELVAGARALVRQRQIGRDVKDFATGLRDALREDPDVLVIGEMREPETISLALTAAETGHLVITSLHSRSAASAIERIVDTYPPERQGQIRVQLADALRAIVSQRLLPRAQGGGRVPAIEVLRVTHNVAAVIREGKTAQIGSAIQSGKREGMISLERCLADLVASGQITAEDARAAANEPASLSVYMA